MMNTNFSLLFYLKKQKNYVCGNVPIYMRITVEGDHSEIATNGNCDPKRWNEKGSRAIGSKEDIKVLNIHLDQILKIGEFYISNKKLIFGNLL